MRLIDGDSLKRKAQKVATESWKMKIKANVETVINQFIDWIDAAPTIEPQRKTGKWEQESESLWKDRRSRWKCSACGKHVLIGVYDDPIEAGLMFCPRCGAEMLRMEGGNG